MKDIRRRMAAPQQTEEATTDSPPIRLVAAARPSAIGRLAAALGVPGIDWSFARAIVVMLPAVVVALMGYQRRWDSEDGFINVRVVQNILDGYGPVLNVDERVEAYTNPLWVAMLTVWGALGARIETGAVALGLLLSVGGVLASQAGAVRLLRRIEGGPEAPPSGVVLPLGALVLVVVPATWDFVTSGLETALVFGWMGTAFWLLVRTVDSDGREPGGGTVRAAPSGPWLLTAAVLGLGPLVRPDLLIFSAAFLVALFVGFGSRPGRRRQVSSWARLLAAAGFAPVAYQLFRMGYFAALVPNTALAKEAGMTNWLQGWRYLEDFAGPYKLWIPLLLLLGWWAAAVNRVWCRHGWTTKALLLTPLLAAALHAVFVVRLGGDFMHGRFLLPALFGALLPVATVVVPCSRMQLGRSLVAGASAIVIAGWAFVCGFHLRVPYEGGLGPNGIADERGVYVGASGQAHPVTVDDYAAIQYYRDGQNLRNRSERRRWEERQVQILLNPEVAERQAMPQPQGLTPLRVLYILDYFPNDPGAAPEQEMPLSPAVSDEIDLVASLRNLGVIGVLAGPHVHLVDRHGLSDPIASRLWLDRRGRPGHEKFLTDVWIVARYADPAVVDSPEVTAARSALACGALDELRHAVEDPLTVRRFISNVVFAWTQRDLRIPGDPFEAERTFCAPWQREQGRLTVPAGLASAHQIAGQPHTPLSPGVPRDELVMDRAWVRFSGSLLGAGRRPPLSRRPRTPPCSARPPPANTR